MNNIEKVREILNKTSWLELDLSIDLEQWTIEANIASEYLIPYRENESNGWSSVAIHAEGENIYSNVKATYSDYSWTKLSEKTPTIKRFWEQMPFENLARIRFMGVEPHGYVGKHRDLPPSSVTDMLDFIIPINIAIIHPDDCYMTLTDIGVVPFKSGKVILVNITNEHSVTNNSDTRRIHLIGYGRPGNRIEEFCDLIIRSYDKIQ
jgi:hypothetical protein